MIRRLAFVIVLILCGPLAHAQSLWVNANSPTVTSGTSVSESMTVGACAPNCAAFVWVSTLSTGGYPSVSVTYNSVSMTSAGTPQQQLISGTNYQLQWFYLANPATGSNTLTISTSGGGVTVTTIKTNLIAYSGVNQSTPIRPGTYQGTTGTGSTVSLTLSSNIQDVTTSATLSGSGTPNLNSTNQTNDGIQNSGVSAGSDHETTGASTPPATSVTHTWTYSTTANAMEVGFSIQAASWTPACVGAACITNSCRINYWGSTNTNTCTIGSFTAGDTIVCFCLTLTSTCPNFSFSDTQTTGYTNKSVQCLPAGEAGYVYALTIGKPASSGSITFTLLDPQFGFSVGVVAEISHLGSFDTSTGANGTSGTGTLSSGNLTTATTNEILLGGGFSYSTTFTAGSGYTVQVSIVAPDFTASNVPYGDYLETALAPTAGTYSATFASAGTAAQWAVIAAAFDIMPGNARRHISTIY